jgi:hypothetical protein
MLPEGEAPQTRNQDIVLSLLSSRERAALERVDRLTDLVEKKGMLEDPLQAEKWIGLIFRLVPGGQNASEKYERLFKALLTSGPNA